METQGDTLFIQGVQKRFVVSLLVVLMIEHPVYFRQLMFKEPNKNVYKNVFM